MKPIRIVNWLAFVIFIISVVTWIALWFFPMSELKANHHMFLIITFVSFVLCGCCYNLEHNNTLFGSKKHK